MSEDVKFAREVDAPLETVFDTFTRPDGQVAFYGQGDPGWIVESECDLRVQRGLPTAKLRREHLVGVPNAFARLERAIGDSKEAG